jgi:hypothetical protein
MRTSGPCLERITAQPEPDARTPAGAISALVRRPRRRQGAVARRRRQQLQRRDLVATVRAALLAPVGVHRTAVGEGGVAGAGSLSDADTAMGRGRRRKLIASVRGAVLDAVRVERAAILGRNEPEPAPEGCEERGSTLGGIRLRLRRSRGCQEKRRRGGESNDGDGEAETAREAQGHERLSFR